MNWLNLETRTRTRPEFIGAEPPERATWLCLMLYCAEHETGGVIRDCALWGDRRWMQTVGCTKAEAHASCELWAWADADLLLWGYPAEKEAEVAAKREGGRKGGIHSAEARRKHGHEAGLEAMLEAEPERKGKERKGIGKEEEEEGAAARAFSDLDLSNPTGQLAALGQIYPAVAESAWVSELAAGRANPTALATAVQEFVRDAANAVEPFRVPTSVLRGYIRSALRVRSEGGNRDDGTDEWRRVRADVADRIWIAQETGANVADAIRAMRDGYTRARKLDGRDPVTAGVDMAMNNKRPAGGVAI